MNPELFAVAVRLLEREGWAALNLDRIAEAAGVSRATVWRHGITRTSVERQLRIDLADDYRALMLPVLALPGTGANRLTAGIEALCELADRHLALLAHSELFLHEAAVVVDGAEINPLSPLVRFIEEGVADGSLADIGEAWPFAAVLFNAVALTYVHLRVHHTSFGWTAPRARRYILSLVGNGYLYRDPGRGAVSP